MSFVRKNLSADALVWNVRESIIRAKLPLANNAFISWEDCIMSGLAIFGQKNSSLLQFDFKKAL